MFGNMSSLPIAEGAFANNAQDGINEDVSIPIIKYLNIHDFIAILNSFSGKKKNHFSSHTKCLKENVPFNLVKTNLSC